MPFMVSHFCTINTSDMRGLEGVMAVALCCGETGSVMEGFCSHGLVAGAASLWTGHLGCL